MPLCPRNSRINRRWNRVRLWSWTLESRIAPATFTVSNLSDPLSNINDPLPGTLRYAVNQANNSPNSGGVPDDILIIDMGKVPMSAPMSISEGVDIDPFGASEVTIDMSEMSTPGPAFKVCAGQSSDVLPVTFTGLTITGAKGSPAIMAMDRDVVIQNCEITGNTNTGPGGGVYFASSSDPYKQLTIQNSTIAGNSSGADGGGVYLKNHVNAVITNSTIAGNIATGRGGGIASNLAGMNAFTMRNSTVTANTANGAQGGGVFFAPGGATPLVFSSIVSGNFNPGGSSPDISGGQVTLQLSAVSSLSGFAQSATSGGNLAQGANLALGALGNNGGETRTIALLPGSAAIDKGANPLNTPFDQRGGGFVRLFDNPAIPNAVGGDGTDIGAYESSPIPYARSKRMDVFTSGGATFSVVVTYTDDIGINPSSIDINDITVSGTGFALPASPSSVMFVNAGNTLTATYVFGAPGGFWNPTDNGTYTVAMRSGQVFDIDPIPHAVPSTSFPTSSLGDFFVNIPVSLLVDEATDINDGNTSVGHLSIREAIVIANAQNARNATTISFDSKVFTSPQTITITPALGEMNITAPVTINGPTAGLTLSGGNTSRIFNINVPTLNSQPTPPSTSPPAPIGSVFINGLTLTSGATNTASGGAVLIQNGIVSFNNCTISNSSAFQNGGGISTGSGGSVTLISTTVSGNTAGTSGSGGGGGVYVAGNGTLLVESSTVSGNTVVGSAGGGGIYLLNSTTNNSAIVESTISGNAGPHGGGVYLKNWQGTSFKVFNSTITNNKATTSPDGGGILIGGVGSNVGTLTLSSTILAGNTAANGPDLEFLAPLPNQNVGGDNNLVGVIAVGNFTLTGASNLTGSPGLNALGNNGGPTQTHSLQAGSQAINNGNNVLCLDFDQRGAPLAMGQPISIGSFGTNITPPTVTNIQIGDGTSQRSMVTQVVVTFSNNVTVAGTLASSFLLNRDSAPPAGPNSEQGGVTGLVNVIATQTAGNTVTLTFSNTGANPIFAVGGAGNLSLPDGRYTLTVVGSNIMNPGATMAGNFVLASAPAPAAPTNIYRFFGDIDGDGAVGVNDFAFFRQYFNSSVNLAFDYNGDGFVGTNDFMLFRRRFGGMLP
jgi:Right handed beta helix region